MERFSIDVAGRPLTLETGRLAKQAGGAVLVRYGDTTVLSVATASASPREGIDWFPLTVDYEERMYAAGRIPGNWFRREGRPTAKAILSARLTDRPIRPLFPDGFRNDVQVVSTVLAVDGDNAPEVCSIIGASAALTISDVPWAGPIAAVIIGLIDGQLVVNPTAEQQGRAEMHLIVSGTKDAINMVEAGANEIGEEQMLEALMLAHDEIKKIVAVIEEMRAKVGKPKREIKLVGAPENMDKAVRAAGTDRLRAALMNPEKLQRQEDMARVKAELISELAPQFEGQEKMIGKAVDEVLREQFRKTVAEDGIRPDGRALDEVRPITVEVGVLPRTHGTGLFTRGQTQVMTVATLGTKGDTQELDDLSLEEEKRYLHHYNFPPFSVGETRPMRGPGRREIGHGALAERALEPMIPPEQEFPYTIRLVSEVLESNGSSSMASVCGSTLALMDAGVPIKAPVAGVAMGLIKEGDKIAILTDIQGLEDHDGDMDFKVAGTANGITALQMDIKIAGVTREVLAKALAQAKAGRLFILGKMLAVLPESRKELSPFAPRIITLHIDPDKIREVIGPGGKIINKIIAECSVGREKIGIDIEDDGTIYIASVNRDSGEKAVKMIEGIVKDPVPGETYTGTVTRLMNFGAFVEIMPGKEGLVHISELATERVERVEDVVKVGDEVTVKVMEIDKLGRINLSRRAVLDPEGTSRQGEDRVGARSGGSGGGMGRPGGPGRPGGFGGGGRGPGGPRGGAGGPGGPSFGGGDRQGS
ncbi:MAG: polyribonucleotide nucleotidyltransferase [Symbiobacteriia bacterium]